VMKHPRLVVGGSLLALGLGYLLLRSPSAASLPGGVSPKLPGGPLPPGVTILTSYLSDAFFRRLAELGSYFRSRGARVTDEELLAVLYVESGGVDPASINKISGCVGLNQICSTLKSDPLSGLKAVGFNGTKDEYRALPGERQLDFVQAFFDKQGNVYPRIRSLSNLYLVNFSPAFLGQADDFVMYRPEGITHEFLRTKSNPNGFFGPEYYNDNAGVDSNPRKGYIEVADMGKFIVRHVGGAKWNELRARLQRAQPAPVAVAGFGGGPCYACLTSRYGCGGQGCSRRKG